MQQIKASSSLLLIISPLLIVFVLISVAMAEEAAVHIIYTEKPESEEPDAFHIKTLASVLGSEDAAKGAMLYSYKHAASGFSAKLTPTQVEEMSKKPGVLQVVPSRTLQLHSGPGRMNV